MPHIPCQGLRGDGEASSAWEKKTSIQAAATARMMPTRYISNEYLSGLSNSVIAYSRRDGETNEKVDSPAEESALYMEHPHSTWAIFFFFFRKAWRLVVEGKTHSAACIGFGELENRATTHHTYAGIFNGVCFNKCTIYIQRTG